MERRARAFAAQLTPADRPPFCMGCYNDFAQMQFLNEPLLNELRSNCPEYFTAIMTFIMTPRSWTSEDCVATSKWLMLCWRKCRSCTPPTSKQRADEERLFEQMFSKLCTQIGICFVLDNSRARKLNKLPKKRLWPLSSDALFPFGIAQGIEALVTAYAVIPTVPVVITPMLAVQRPRVLPELLKEPIRTKVMTRLVNDLKKVAALAARCSAQGREAGASPEYIQEFIASRMNHEEVQLPIFLLWTVSGGVDCSFGELDAFIFGFQLEVYNGLTGILDFLADVQKEHWSSVAADIAGQIYSTIPQRVRPKDTPSYISVRAPKEAGTVDPYSILCGAMHYIRARRSCWGPGCGKTPQDSRKILSLCARCTLVQYCSKECQKRDWKREHYPHKEICGILQELSTFMRIDISRPEFKKECEERGLSVESARMVIDWYYDTIIPGLTRSRETLQPNAQLVDFVKTVVERAVQNLK